MNHNSLNSAKPGKHTAAVDFGIAAAGLVRFANTGKAQPAADEQPQMSGANNHPARALKEKIQFRQLMKSVRMINWLWVVVIVSLATVSWAVEPSAPKPNIIYILADDLGYGDVQCYNPQRGKIPTPKLDRLAAEGMRFTDAHTGPSVCTPTRYSVLTGRYAWRTHLQSGVLNGFSAPLIIQDRTTVASLLKANGYQTACIGK